VRLVLQNGHARYAQHPGNLHASQNAKWLCSRKSPTRPRAAKLFFVCGAVPSGSTSRATGHGQILLRLHRHSRVGVRTRAGVCAHVPGLRCRSGSRAATRQGAGRTARARSLRGCVLRSGIGLSTRGRVAPYGLPRRGLSLIPRWSRRHSGACPNARPCPLAHGRRAKKM